MGKVQILAVLTMDCLLYTSPASVSNRLSAYLYKIEHDPKGHKGTGSAAGAWMRRRDKLTRDGFAFEYSATFGQAVAGDVYKRQSSAR